MKTVSRIYVQCDRCGMEYSYDVKELGTTEDFTKNKCHSIDLGVPGYSSVFDGCTLKFEICDKCLEEIINTF